jgi:hypothetical protein
LENPALKNSLHRARFEALFRRRGDVFPLLLVDAVTRTLADFRCQVLSSFPAGASFRPTRDNPASVNRRNLSIGHCKICGTSLPCAALCADFPQDRRKLSIPSSLETPLIFRGDDRTVAREIAPLKPGPEVRTFEFIDLLTAGVRRMYKRRLF